MTDPVEIATLTAEAAHAAGPALAAVLIDCVENGASVSFMAPLSRQQAEAFWTAVAEDVAAAKRLLIVARLGREIVGTVQIVLDVPENQPHRADLAKMLVRSDARRLGVGARLLDAAEAAARAAGRTLLVLDTGGAEAERLYARSGWVRVGVIPGYALWPDGRPCDTTFFFKSLAATSGEPVDSAEARSI